jgi:saccharopine dehydrogenase-like NADP-dependent oxidoreductase
MDGVALEKAVKRIIVLGGLGKFGRAAAEELRRTGLAVQTAARRSGADLQVDANDADSVRAIFQRGDIVVDAAGPFYSRSTALVECAIDVGFNVIDINDDLRYAESVLSLAPRIDAVETRVLTSASTVSAVTAAIVRQSGIARPRSVTAFLAPASRHTANAGAALSLIRCVGPRHAKAARITPARKVLEPSFAKHAHSPAPTRHFYFPIV